MSKNELLDALAEYGYSVMRPTVEKQPEEVLESLLKQEDSRLAEAFPVVYLNALQKKEMLAWEDKKWQPAKNFSQKTADRLALMLGLSKLLFDLFGLQKYSGRTSKLLKNKMGSDEFKKLMNMLQAPFLKSEGLNFDSLELSCERLKNNFRNYVVLADQNSELEKKKHELELELLLSELFTARQKDLLKKRLEGKELTKTEREYFYRVVKKRLKALANEELHQIARRLIS